MERGYTRVPDAEGAYPYEEFQIDSTEPVYLTLTQFIDGVEVVRDVSASNIKVYLRAKLKAAATVPINVEMTKRAGSVANGDTGKVSANVTLRAADFPTAGAAGEMGVYIVDTSIPDAATPSTYQETLHRGLWEFVVRGPIDSAVP